MNFITNAFADIQAAWGAGVASSMHEAGATVASVSSTGERASSTASPSAEKIVEEILSDMRDSEPEGTSTALQTGGAKRIARKLADAPTQQQQHSKTDDDAEQGKILNTDLEDEYFSTEGKLEMTRSFDQLEQLAEQQSHHHQEHQLPVHENLSASVSAVGTRRRSPSLKEPWLLPGERIFLPVYGVGYLRMQDQDQDLVSQLVEQPSAQSTSSAAPSSPSIPEMSCDSDTEESDLSDMLEEETSEGREERLAQSVFDINRPDDVDARNRELDRIVQFSNKKEAKLKLKSTSKSSKKRPVFASAPEMDDGDLFVVKTSDLQGAGSSRSTSPTSDEQRREVLMGTLYITNYELRFVHKRRAEEASPGSPSSPRGSSASSEEAEEQEPSFVEYVVSTPLSTILKLEERYPYGEQASAGANVHDCSTAQRCPDPSGIPCNHGLSNCTGYIEIRCKDFEFINLLFYSSSSDSTHVAYLLLDHLAYPKSPQQFFCFEFGKATIEQANYSFNMGQQQATASPSSAMTVSISSMPAAASATAPAQAASTVVKTIKSSESRFTRDAIAEGWNVYVVDREFERQGVKLDGSDRRWKKTAANDEYELCDTYPRELVVPRNISDSKLAAASLFRSKGRIPVLTWNHPQLGTCLARCSEPGVGISGSRSFDDEELVEQIMKSAGANNIFIIDARPKANAMANMALGKGYENVKFYAGATIEFLSIDNIHSMTKSLNVLNTLCEKPTDVYWLSAMENSGWLRHLRQLLTGANRIVELLHTKREPVLLHCSDGWDRTSQLSALAEIMLDPYYRTIEGFEVLVEKEWVSFGHKFQDRAGHIHKANSSEFSPIFIEWIDAVWHIWQQFHESFEFNEIFLITIADHVYSCLFGNFIANSAKELDSMNVKRSTISLWTYINSDLAKYKNPFYKDPIQEIRRKEHKRVQRTHKRSSSEARSPPVATSPFVSMADTIARTKEYPIDDVLKPDPSIATLSTNFFVMYWFRYLIGLKSKMDLVRKLKQENAIIRQKAAEEKASREKLEQELRVYQERMAKIERFFSNKGIPMSLEQELDPNSALELASQESQEDGTSSLPNRSGLVVVRRGKDNDEHDDEQEVAVISDYCFVKPSSYLAAASVAIPSGAAAAGHHRRESSDGSNVVGGSPPIHVALEHLAVKENHF